MDRPWLQLFTRDWLDNKELRRCSPVSRAVLTDLMCLAHEGEPYGVLADKVGPLTESYMVSRCVVTKAAFRSALKELEAAHRLSKREDGALTVPRMVRDEEVRLKRAAGGVLGGNPKVPRKVNLEPNLPGNLPNEQEGGFTHARSRALTLTLTSDSESGISASDSERKKSVVSGTRAAWEVDEHYIPFVVAYREARPNTLTEEFADAHRPFLLLSFEQRLLAVQGVTERVRIGLWDPAQWQMVMKPSKYLQAEWKRALPPIQKRLTSAIQDRSDETARITQEILERKGSRRGN
jgi:hypothetical protein